MDADKWSDYYERTKEDEDERQAMTDLVNGMLRELKSRMEQANPWDNPSDIAQEVDEMYKEVASRHIELREEGFSDLVKKRAPEIGALFEQTSEAHG